MDWGNFGLGSAAGGFGSGLGAGLFGDLFPNPADKAQGPLGQIPGTISPYYNPYIQAGQGALGQLQGQYGNLLQNGGQVQGQYNQMMQDPNSIISRIGAGYHQSPGYQWQLGQGEQAINNANAAGGMLGTPQHQQQAGQLAENLGNQDYQNYLQQGLGLYNQGVQGAQGLYGAGLQGLQGLNTGGQNASSELAQALAQALSQQSGLQYSGQANQNQMTGGLLGNIFGMFGGGGNAGGAAKAASFF